MARNGCRIVVGTTQWRSIEAERLRKRPGGVTAA
jgi:hypothetical protein